MINYGGFYVNVTGSYKVLNPVLDIQGDKTVKKVLFLSVGNGKLYTMLEDEFLQKFKELEKE
jgi:hypothetical protein